jgi:RNA polymerase sigma factor (sigma-70 family)
LITLNNILPTRKPTSEKSGQERELEKILKGCELEDRSAQEKLYKKYYGLLMAVCLRYYKNKDDATAALNQAFLKIFQKVNQYRFEGSFEGWMTKLTINSILDELRKKTINYEVLNESIETNDESVLPKLYFDDLLKLLNQLPESTKVVFNLFAVEGFKHHEIAEQLNISVGTTKWHVSEAKKKLRLLINTHYGQQ